MILVTYGFDPGSTAAWILVDSWKWEECEWWLAKTLTRPKCHSVQVALLFRTGYGN